MHVHPNPYSREAPSMQHLSSFSAEFDFPNPTIPSPSHLHIHYLLSLPDFPSHSSTPLETTHISNNENTAPPPSVPPSCLLHHVSITLLHVPKILSPSQRYYPMENQIQNQLATLLQSNMPHGEMEWPKNSMHY